MQIRVVPDYVSALHNLGENVRCPLDSTADDEKHRARSMGIESVQYARSNCRVRTIVEGQEDRRAVLWSQTLDDQFPRQRTFQSGNHEGERPREGSGEGLLRRGAVLDDDVRRSRIGFDQSHRIGVVLAIQP